ncbi:MAG: ABC transporter permease [Rhodospirillales bacterium]|nr:ABC transporter permease [Rhodospirillales bacterium]
MTDTSTLTRLALQGGSIVILLGLWAMGAMVADSTLLPTPLEVFTGMAKEANQGELLHHLGVTLMRVGAAFFISFIIGTAIGITMGRSKLLNTVFDPWLVLFLNIPALVTIILAYVWFGLIEAAAIFAVSLNKIPNVAITMREGARTLDKDLMEMAASFRLDRKKTLTKVILPQLYPYMAASARSGLALIWKIVLVVELLGRSNGIGFQLHLYFQLFDVTMILAYAFAFIIVIQTIELMVLQPVERHVNRWRR